MKGLAKAKTIGANKWIEGYFIKQYHTATIYIPDEQLKNHNFDFYHVDENTYCRDTGITDKNGNKIWENDIVKDNVIFGTIIWDKNNARFVINDINDGYQDYSDWWHEVEVIGNIFDNPELLKNTETAPSMDEDIVDLKEFAEKLNGRDYFDCPQIPKDLAEFADKNNIVIVYGASDDLMEFEGAIYDEADCFDGGKVCFNKNGVKKNASNMIEAVWCDENRVDENGNVITWTYKTDIPHETFMIYDGGEPYCEGIVFRLSDLR